MKPKSARITQILSGFMLAGLLLGLAILAGLLSYKWAHARLIEGNSIRPPQPTILAPNASPTSLAEETSNPFENIIRNPDPTGISQALQPWDGTGRVTILLLGLDFRDWEQKRDYPRSDTMILLTLDPAKNTAGMLSIPRDMWVAIPGFEHGKINTAYYLGEAYKLPGGGPGLAIKTVEQFLGVPINYYAQIDFAAFERFIDEIGGVIIDVPQQITVDMLGGEGVKTKKVLQPGRQALPGAWALAYARARYTEGGDFDRARRQQQVIMAIRERMLSRDLLLQMIQKAPALYRELASGIHTNLKLDDVIRLALSARSVSEEDIKQGVLGKEYVMFGFSEDELSILVPIPDKIHVLRDEIFISTGSMQPATPGDALQRMQAEQPRLTIYNGSRDGTLAERTAEFLAAQGARVLEAGQAKKSYTSTTLIDHSGSPFTLAYLVELINSPTIKIYSEYDPGSPVDVEVFLGEDWARGNSLP